MTKQGDMSGWESSARGESAWKEMTDRVAERNDQVRKAGKREREGHERARETVRQAAAAKRDAKLFTRRTR